MKKTRKIKTNYRYAQFIDTIKSVLLAVYSSFCIFIFQKLIFLTNILYTERQAYFWESIHYILK